MDLASQLAQIDVIEITLMNKRQVNVFQIPPIASAQGHKAEDWRGKQIWTGFCRVMMVNSTKCKVQLVNEDNTMFAESSFNDENYDPYIQRCFDSSRFFALLLVNDNGQKALVGVGFPERNDSFDFIAALEDFKKQLRSAKGIVDQGNFKSGGPSKDFSLKEGEKISINIPGLNKKPAEGVKSSTGGFGGGLKKLAPPPGKSQSQITGSSGMMNFGASAQNQFGNNQVQQNPSNAANDLLSMGVQFGGSASQQNTNTNAAGQWSSGLGSLDFGMSAPSGISGTGANTDDLFGDFSSAPTQQQQKQTVQGSAGANLGQFDDLFGGSGSTDFSVPKINNAGDLLDF